MQLTLTGRHVTVSPPLRQMVGRRLGRIERLLNDSIVSAQVVLTLEKREHRTEIVIHARGDHTLSADGSASNWPQSIGAAVEKIVQQAQKVKDKWTSRKRRRIATSRVDGVARREASAASGEDAGATYFGPQIVRMTRYAIKPMRVEDAALRMQQAREPFLVFRHAETARVAILVARPDGRLGLIDPEA
jgi:putative sigma-54 modulation protein